MDKRLETYKRLDVKLAEFASPIKVCTNVLDLTPVKELETEEIEL